MQQKAVTSSTGDPLTEGLSCPESSCVNLAGEIFGPRANKIFSISWLT